MVEAGLGSGAAPAGPLPPIAEVLQRLQACARQAGELILQVYGTAFEVSAKSDASPVTQADGLAEACIVAALRELQPSIPIVAEEAVSAGPAPTVGERFWLVDPLDGTREFVARNGEFTVNIALIEHGVPVLGVVYAPVLDEMYLGCTLGGDAGAGQQGAWQVSRGVPRSIRCREVPIKDAVLACSRSHGDDAALQAWLGQQAGLAVCAHRAIGSSLKFCLLAAGEVDVYPRFGPTMEWDTAAGHAVLRAAGGSVRDMHGLELAYGKRDFRNPHFVAWGRRAAVETGPG